jgi:polar amino acid transport system substrate-binding protein
VPDLAAALDLLEAGEVDAVVHDRPLLQHQISSQAREAKVLDLLFQKQVYAIALPEQSPLREPIDRSLLSLTGGGDFELTSDSPTRSDAE